MDKIDSFEGEYEFLSNFYTRPIAFLGYVYRSAEHAFQSQKPLDLALQRWIADSGTAATAKKRGKEVPLRDNWMQVRIHIMRAIIEEKFRDPLLRDALLLTGDAELVEGNWWGDTFWGVCEGVGENHLGKILMDTRASIRALHALHGNLNKGDHMITSDAHVPEETPIPAVRPPKFVYLFPFDALVGERPPDDAKIVAAVAYRTVPSTTPDGPQMVIYSTTVTSATEHTVNRGLARQKLLPRLEQASKGNSSHWDIPTGYESRAARTIAGFRAEGLKKLGIMDEYRFRAALTNLGQFNLHIYKPSTNERGRHVTTS